VTEAVHVKETIDSQAHPGYFDVAREITKLHGERDSLKEANASSSPSLSPPFSCSSE